MEIDEKILEKTSTLVEALPYIQKFRGKVFVIKYGGSAMKDENLKRQVMQDLAILKSVGIRPVLVHGGGKEISRWVEKAGGQTTFVKGLRVTDNYTMEVVEMVLNRVNKSLVQHLNGLGVQSVGLSGKDANLARCVKKYVDGEDIGFVGDVVKIDPTILNRLIEDDYIPVICPIGYDEHGNSYNVNADDMACAIAASMGAEKLAFLTDVDGIYKDFNDKSSRVTRMNLDEAQAFVDSGELNGGMLPKLQSCINALKKDVNVVHILDGRVPHCLLLEIFTKQGIGTMIEKSIEGYVD